MLATVIAGANQENITSIDDPPAEVVTRKVPRHSEGDLINDVGNCSAEASLVARTSRLHPGMERCNRGLLGLHSRNQAHAA